MTKIIRIFSLLLLFTLVIGISTAEAQRSKKKKKKDSTEEYFDESGGFAHRLWYGGGFNLNFGGVGGFNSMQIGISPMVGFKINDILSVGPRVSFDYLEVFTQGSNPRYAFWGVGPFARGKFTETIFAQVEYEIRGVSNLNDASDNFGGFQENRENFYIGAGYQSSGGGLIGYEIMALYNFLDQNPTNIPLTFRFGLNWNF